MPQPRSVERIAEHQARSFEIRAQRDQRDRSPQPRPPGGPYLAISRQFGSGGTELARRLGERLGWEVLDRELVTSMAAALDADPRALAAHDEHAVRPFDDYLSHLFVPADPGLAGYLQAMMHVAVERARRGRAILVGRGANWFLDPGWGLRVRLVAPLERRAARVAERDRLDRAAAEHVVRQRDLDQQRFVRQFFHRDVEDPLGYDAVLNVDALGEPLVEEWIVAALKGRP